MNKRARAILLSILVLILIALAFGHSELNYRIQLKRAFHHLSDTQKLSPYSDPIAVKELQAAKKAMNIEFQEIERNQSSPQPTMTAVVLVNGNHNYRVTMTCYTYPFSFAIYEKWHLVQIQYGDKS